MHAESVDTLSLLELRAMVAQACLVIWHLTAGREGQMLYRTHLARPADRVSSQTVLDTIARLCPEVIAAVQEYVAAWRGRFRQDGWHPTQWAGYCEGLKGILLEGFVTGTRQ